MNQEIYMKIYKYGSYVFLLIGTFLLINGLFFVPFIESNVGYYNWSLLTSISYYVAGIACHNSYRIKKLEIVLLTDLTEIKILMMKMDEVVQNEFNTK